MKKADVFVVSGGTGASGKLVAQTVLAQFDDADVNIHIVPGVKETDQFATLLEEVEPGRSVVVHTLVDARLRENLIDQLNDRHIPSVDLVGSLLRTLSPILKQHPLGQPGRFRQLNDQYYKRVAAVEFAVDHDDGARSRELPLAEIVLTGVSRVGKTPISMYLSTLGWKVANVPLAMGVTPPHELFEIDSQRVFGLTLDAGQLIHHRQIRQHRIGSTGVTSYFDPETVYEEIQFAKRLFRRGAFTVIDMTDRPVEEASEQIIRRMTSLA